jgi:hypothetical protein
LHVRRCTLARGLTRWQSHNLAVAGSVSPPGIFRDRTNVETKLRGETLAYLADFVNNRIR